jgi:NADPH:quinone reductase-like Zn-dependent oxidoreductase
MNASTLHPSAPVPRTMTAWWQTRYGSPAVVGPRTVDLPRLKPRQVLLRVRATALNSADVRVMRGNPALLRLAFGLRRPRTPVQGRDVCGTVVAVGAAVTRWKVGDELVGEIGGGGLADYVVAAESSLVARSDGLDPVIAAALPMAGGTARQALDLAALRADGDRRVLVLGAGGGVGTFTVQLAALDGAEVWAVCGARAEPLLLELGAAVTFDHRTVELAQLAEHHVGCAADAGRAPTSPGFDAVIDIAGTAPLAVLQALLREGGCAVLVSGGGSGLLGPLPRMIHAALRSRRRRRIRSLAAMPRTAITTELLSLATAGRLRPAIERTWPLGEAGAALAHVDAGHTVGKVVVTAPSP